MTCVAFSIKFAKTNQKFTENSEFCENYSLFSKLFTGVFTADLSDRYSLKGPRWAELSEKAKHFVHSLLRKDPNDRLTASEAQEHSWLHWKNKGAQASASIDTKVLRDMSQFAATNTITRTALGLLAHQTFSGIAGEEDLKSLEDQFKKLDVSRSGQIKITLAVLTTIRLFLPLTFFSFSEYITKKEFLQTFAEKCEKNDEIF